MYDTAILGVATQFDIPVTDLIGPRRTADLIPARCAAAYLLRHCYPNLTLSTIGQLLGGRDHTTVRHALHKAALLASKNVTYSGLLQTLLDAHQAGYLVVPHVMRTAGALPDQIWTSAQAKRLLFCPTALLRDVCMRDWIAAHGGVSRLYQQLALLRLPRRLHQIRCLLLASPYAPPRAEVAACTLGVSLKTYYRHLDRLALEFATALNAIDLGAIVFPYGGRR